MSTLTIDLDVRIRRALEMPGSFAYWGEHDLGVTWGFTPFAQTRDSGTITRSNFEVIKKDLTERFGDDVDVLCSSHWAHGWSEQIIVRVKDNDDQPTSAFEAVVEWEEALENYPVASDDHLSELEVEENLGTLEQCYTHLIRDDAPDDWTHRVLEHLDIGDPVSLTEASVREAAELAGFAAVED